MAWAAALTPLISQGVEELFRYDNNQNQLQQQGALEQQQLGIQEQGAQYMMNLQNTQGLAANPQMRMQQYADAGLNPALMYSNGGGGGGGMIAGMGVQGGSAPQPQQANPNVDTGAIAQLAEVDADVKLKEAQAKNIDADTQNKPKVGENIVANTGNVQADTALKQAQTESTMLANSITAQSSDSQVQAWQLRVTELLGKSTSAMVQAGIDQTTVNTKIDQLKANLAGTILQNNLTKAQTTTTETQAAVNTQSVYQMGQQVLQGWQNLDNQGKILKIQALIGEFNATAQNTSGVAKEIFGQPNRMAASLVRQIDAIAGTTKQ